MSKSIRKMTAKEKKRYIRSLFRGYRAMTQELEQSLSELGVRVEHTRKHIKLYYNGRLFTCPSSPSDARAGLNFAANLCRAIKEQDGSFPLPQQTPTERISI